MTARHREPSVRDIPQIIANLRAALTPPGARPPGTPPVQSAFTTAMALNVIVHRGSLAPGDLEAIRAATVLLYHAHRTGVL